MVLATHLITGGILGRAVGSSPVAFVAGFISHFLLDAIPHWDYQLSSLQGERDSLDKDLNVASLNFVFDLVKIGSDFLIGVLSLFFIFNFLHWSITTSVIWGAIGGVLPDFLQLAYVKLRWPLLRQLQRFHMWFHANQRLDGVLGPVAQVGLVLLFLAGAVILKL